MFEETVALGPPRIQTRSVRVSVIFFLSRLSIRSAVLELGHRLEFADVWQGVDVVSTMQTRSCRLSTP